ncbi:MAG: hypothetical protein GY936_12070 [Ignavibacteriae bacterium]|nr:hypothetical protein [Ignavibacteriota bacterium]
MNTKNYKILLLMVLFIFFTLPDVVAQKDNKIGIGYNLSFTEGYSPNLVGLKLYYERAITPRVSLKGNIDLIMPDKLVQLPIDVSAIYNFQIKQLSYKFFIGFGIGYYWLKDNSNRPYSYDDNARANYVNFEEKVWGISYIAGIDNIWNNFNLEIKYILLSVEQFERYSSDDHPLAPSTSRWQKIELNTLRLSLSSYCFNF